MPDALIASAPCVGRRNELATLANLADRLFDDGRLGVALVSGESGIGKSTLAAEFARTCIQGTGATVWFGRCDEVASEPLQPFRRVLSDLVSVLPDDVISAHASACGEDLLPAIPHLEHRLSAPTRREPGDEITSRLLLFEAACDLMRRAAALAPMVVVVDDLHWAEPAGLQLLRHLVRNLASSPMLFVVCFRDTGEADGDEFRSVMAELSREDAARIELEGLDAAELGDLVRTAHESLADGRVDVAPVAEAIRAESAGNPLYAAQLLRHYTSSGQIRVDDQSAVVDRDSTEVVPATLRDLIWHRVRGLGPWAQPVLAVAAVLGADIRDDLLHEVSGIDRFELASVLDRAVHAGLLADDPETPGAVRFAHALVARSVVDDLGTRERVRLHRQIFELLAAGRSEQPARVAHHADCAGVYEEALRWSVRAGERALDDLTPDEAATWFGRALGHADRLHLSDSERAEVLAGLGEAEYRAGRPEAFETLRTAADLALGCGANAALLRAALAIEPGSIRLGASHQHQLAIAEAAHQVIAGAGPENEARVLAMLARSLIATHQSERRTALANEALALARESADGLLLATIAPDLLFALWAPGAADIRVRIAREAVETVEQLGRSRQAARLFHAAYWAGMCSADVEFAALCADRLRSLTAEIRQPRTRWLTLTLDVFEATMQCRFAEATEAIESCFELGRQTSEAAVTVYAGQLRMLGVHRGEPPPHTLTARESNESNERSFEIGFARAELDAGRPELAQATLDGALDRGLDTIPSDYQSSMVLVGLAILATELDDTAASRRLLVELEPSAGEVSCNPINGYGPTSLHTGRLCTIVGRFDDAERHLREALAVTERFGWEYHRVAALFGVAVNRLAADGVLDSEAEQFLDDAERTSTELGLKGWLRRVDALRAQLTA